MSLANILPQKDTPMDEVAEAVSPGGHITKRRARSRPVSQELLESAHHSLSPQVPPHVCHPIPFAIPSLTCYQTHSSRIAPPKAPPVAFPSASRNRFSVVSTAAPRYHADGSLAAAVQIRCTDHPPSTPVHPSRSPSF